MACLQQLSRRFTLLPSDKSRLKSIEVGMGVFKEMCDGRHFESGREYTELRRMLSQAISRGFVEQIAVIKPILSSRDEEWYRDTETGEMYCLIPPGEQSFGWWTRIDSEDLVHSGETVQ
jgi:hypothetical protein